MEDVNNIIYEDKITPLKDIGNDIILTNIKNVSKYSLNSCLKSILKLNRDTSFIRIQYSPNDKMLYLYTNNKIYTDFWTNTRNLKTLNSNEAILEELVKVLRSKNYKENDCISLYDVATLLKESNQNYDNIIKKYNKILNEIIKTKLNNSVIVVHDFDYQNNILKISINGNYQLYNKYNEIHIRKEKDDLQIYNCKTIYDEIFIEKTHYILKKMYDEFLQFSNFKTEQKYNIQPVNSNFLVDISNYGVNIHNRNELDYKNSFKLSSNSYSDKYRYNCESNKIINAVKYQEDDIFKKIFIKIDDCPNWTKEILYERRNEQIESQKEKTKTIKYEKRKPYLYIK